MDNSHFSQMNSVYPVVFPLDTSIIIFNIINMKQLFFLLSAIVLVALCSCSSILSPKMITSTSTEFSSGELARYIEVVDEPCELSFSEKDGVISSQFIRLKMKLRLVKDDLKNADPRDIDFTRLLGVAEILLVDENESEVQNLYVKNSELLKLKKLLTGENGDIADIIFEEEFHNHDDAPSWFNDAVKFTPHLTGDISYESTEPQTYNMSGNIGPYSIMMTLYVEPKTQNVIGAYNYGKGKGLLYLTGKINQGSITLAEFTKSGNQTGVFDGHLSGSRFEGKFRANSGEYDFLVSSDGNMDALNYNSINFNMLPLPDYSLFSSLPEDYGYDETDYDETDYDDSSMNSAYSNEDNSSSTSSEDWEEILDEYEKFTDEYIKFVKKAEEGDLSAMTSYLSALEKAQKMSAKLSSSQNMMTPAQTARYMRILNKMSSAAASMRK